MYEQEAKQNITKFEQRVEEINTEITANSEAPLTLE